VLRRRHIIQILNGFSGKEIICKYKKLATVCPPNMDFGNILNPLNMRQT